MGASQWFVEHWFDLAQAVSVVGSLLFAAYTFRKDEMARRIANLIAIAAGILRHLGSAV